MLVESWRKLETTFVVVTLLGGGGFGYEKSAHMGSVLGDRGGFRDRGDRWRRYRTGRDLQRRTINASLPDDSIRGQRSQLLHHRRRHGDIYRERHDRKDSHS